MFLFFFFHEFEVFGDRFVFFSELFSIGQARIFNIGQARTHALVSIGPFTHHRLFCPRNRLQRQTDAILSAMPCLVSELIDSPLLCSAAVQASVRCSCPWHRQTGGAGLWSRGATSRKRFSSTTRRYVVGTNYHSISSINAKQGLGYVVVVVRREPARPACG